MFIPTGSAGTAHKPRRITFTPLTDPRLSLWYCCSLVADLSEGYGVEDSITLLLLIYFV